MRLSPVATRLISFKLTPCKGGRLRIKNRPEVRRPELGLFKPFRGVIECPERPTIEKHALIPGD